MPMITRIEDFFTDGCGRCTRFATEDCSVRRWTDGLATLRRICRDAGLTETVKWGHPTYTHAGRNVAIIGAFRDDFRLTFFEAALLADPHGLLVRQGPNTHQPDALRFVDAAALRAMERHIRAFLDQAKDHADAGRTAPKRTEDLALPQDLVEALDRDVALATAFHALTPGRQRSYVLLLSGAKTAATRLTRIERSRSRILAGKGATER